MFEQLLFEHLKNNFTVENFNLSFGYGEISPKTKQPYIIQHTLSMDGTRQVLCNPDNYTDGKSFAQWNIYTTAQSASDYIYQKLFTFIKNLPQLEDYKIGLITFNSGRSLHEPDLGLYMSALAFDIEYYK